MYDLEKYRRVSRSGSSCFIQRTKGNELEPRTSMSLPRLRKMPCGPGELLPYPDQILALELEVEIVRKAVREHVVCGLVRLEAAAIRLGEIDRHGKRQQHDAQQRRCKKTGFDHPRSLLTAFDHDMFET